MNRETSGDPAGQTLCEWARSLAPGLDVVSSSVPDPTMANGHLVAVFAEPDAARPLVLAWERLDEADNAVGFVALGRSADRPEQLARPTGADPEGVTAHAARETFRGGVPGALIGAVVVAVIVLVFEGWSPIVLGGAAGGAVLGAVAGAFVTFVKHTGWGAAFEHSFVDPEATAVAVVGFHSTDPDRVALAREAAREVAGARLGQVRVDGSIGELSRTSL